MGGFVDASSGGVKRCAPVSLARCTTTRYFQRSVMPKPEGPWALALDAADQEVRAAEAILFDARCKRPSLSEVHLIRGWRALALAQSSANGSSPTEDPQEIDLPRFRKREREEWAAGLAAMRRRVAVSLDDPTISGALSVPMLRRHCRWLEQSIRNARRRLSRASDQSVRSRRSRLVAFASVVLLGLLVGGFLASRPTGKWQGEYYANVDLSGTPVRRIDDDVNFDWGEGSPLPGLPKDDFSVQWNTCLRAETSGHARFLLGSDDGSRLFVDGRLLIDNWGPHDFRPIAGETDLQVGLHSLRVDFFDKAGGARVALWLGLGDEHPRAIGSDRIVLPESGPGASLRCGSR